MRQRRVDTGRQIAAWKVRPCRAWEACHTCRLQAKKIPGVELVQELGVEAARLDGQVVQLPLLVAVHQNVLLNGLLADQAVDVDLPGLANAMAAVLRLQVWRSRWTGCLAWYCHNAED